MHVFLSFFGWPAGSTWSNVLAMPSCGVLAGIAAYLLRDRLGRALKGWWHRHLGHRDDLDAIHARLDAHADLLDPHTPGGMAAVMAELRDVKAEIAATAAGVQALSAIAKPTPRRGGATAMQKKAPTGKADTP